MAGLRTFCLVESGVADLVLFLLTRLDLVTIKLNSVALTLHSAAPVYRRLDLGAVRRCTVVQ